MPSKGLDIYSYITGDIEDVNITFTVPEDDADHNSGESNPRLCELEIESSNIKGLFAHTGRFSWTVSRNGIILANGWNDINTLTGNLEGGTMLSSITGPSTFVDNLVITYGFYDAGSGVAGLTNRDQFWISVTKNRSAWMGDLAPDGSSEANNLFSRFALVAPHDPGMNTMQNALALLYSLTPEQIVDFYCHLTESSETLQDAQKSTSLQKATGAGIAHLLPNLMQSLAITQKDSISNLLAIGARYFEFRPAYILNGLLNVTHPLPDVLYFQHACIPGMAFELFLAELVTFLEANPTEIVTVHLRWDGIPAECRRPSPEELHSVISTALEKSSTRVRRGDASCFKRTISALRSSRYRLICLTMSPKYDTYTDAAYGTLDATPILERFDSMTTEGQAKYPITILQCQATASRIKEVLAYSVLASNAATSCVMETKARCDTKTLRWIEENAFERLKGEENVVIMNDFLEGGTVDAGIGLSRQRLAEGVS
ncbi:hypothetical protein MMC14_006506 [Varicellaria rhodocarpa]|nr:hypothetical protein [Varicellaria rhodocarpa]